MSTARIRGPCPADNIRRIVSSQHRDASQEKEVPHARPGSRGEADRFCTRLQSRGARRHALSLDASGHPAVAGAAGGRRVAHDGARARSVLGVVPDNLLLDGAASPQARPGRARNRRAAARPHDRPPHAALEPRSGRLAAIPAASSRSRSTKCARPAASARLWAATGQRHLELQEIDYADILRERGGGQESHWDDIIRACLNLDSPLDDDTLRELMEVCGDAERFSEFVLALEAKRRDQHGLEGVCAAPHAARRHRSRVADRSRPSSSRC